MAAPPPLDKFLEALQNSWSAETSYQKADWSPDNPALGQCVVSALVVQDYYGGDLIRFIVTGDSINQRHYCNLLSDGTLIDITRSQYKVPVSMSPEPVELKGFRTVREKRLAEDDTNQRYERLKKQVFRHLGEYALNA